MKSGSKDLCLAASYSGGEYMGKKTVSISWMLTVK
jgi:hypothetical protein